VKSATLQIVAGVLYTYDTVLLDADNIAVHCKVIILSRPWLVNGNKITFKCQGKDEVVITYNAQQQKTVN